MYRAQNLIQVSLYLQMRHEPRLNDLRIDIMGNMDALPYKVCLTCNHTAIELLPLSDNEHYHFEYTATRGVILEFR